MTYLPPSLRDKAVTEIAFTDLREPPTRLTVLRRLRIRDFQVEHNPRRLLLFVDGMISPLSIPAALWLQFGAGHRNEGVTAANYAEWVLEPGDFIDIVFDPDRPDHYTSFWVHIEHMEERPIDLVFAEKEDGLFALRTKAGEKAERRVARDLISRFGHSYPPAVTNPSGTFKIWYTDKRVRMPDLICQECGLQVESKKRNQDRKYRLSHSEARGLHAENRLDGWHAFVFPDWSIHYVSNRHIMERLTRDNFDQRADRYDGWADLRPPVLENDPPICEARQTE